MSKKLPPLRRHTVASKDDGTPPEAGAAEPAAEAPVEAKPRRTRSAAKKASDEAPAKPRSRSAAKTPSDEAGAEAEAPAKPRSRSTRSSKAARPATPPKKPAVTEVVEVVEAAPADASADAAKADASGGVESMPLAEMAAPGAAVEPASEPADAIEGKGEASADAIEGKGEASADAIEGKGRASADAIEEAARPLDATREPAAGVPARADVERLIRARDIVQRFGRFALAGGAVPVPALDIAAVAGVQVRMLMRLAEHYGTPLSKESARATVMTVMGSVAPHAVGGAAARLVGQGVPVVGTVAAMAGGGIAAHAITRVMGDLFIDHFEQAEGASVPTAGAQAQAG